MCEPFPEVWRPSVEALLRNFDFLFFRVSTVVTTVRCVCDAVIDKVGLLAYAEAATGGLPRFFLVCRRTSSRTACRCIIVE